MVEESVWLEVERAYVETVRLEVERAYIETVRRQYLEAVGRYWDTVRPAVEEQIREWVWPTVQAAVEGQIRESLRQVKGNQL